MGIDGEFYHGDIFTFQLNPCFHSGTYSMQSIISDKLNCNQNQQNNQKQENDGHQSKEQKENDCDLDDASNSNNNNRKRKRLIDDNPHGNKKRKLMNETDSCSWTGSYSELENHVQSCHLAIAQCDCCNAMILQTT